MKLSIAIVNWNTGELLAQCLSSIFEHPPSADSEVFVVDNHSSDESILLARQRFPRVNYLLNGTNLGFPAANNQAIRQSRGEYVLLLNPDTIVRKGALDVMVAFLDQHADAGAAGARLLNPDGSLQPSCSPAPTLYREFLRMFHLGGVRPDGYHAMESWDINKPHQIDVLLGACIMVRKEVLDTIGLMDEAYYMYSEEVDLCERIRRAGWSIFWVPQAQVVHYGGQSTRLAATEMFLQLYRAKIFFFRKHRGRWSSIAYKLILYLAGLARLVSLPLALLKSDRRQKQLEMAGNYRRLLTALPGM